METKNVRNMSIEESILADNLAKEKTCIPNDGNEGKQKKSITLNPDKPVAKNSPSEEEEGSTNSLCKGDRPSKNTVRVPSQTDDQANKNNTPTHSQSPLRKQKTPGKATVRLRSSSRKRVRSQSKSPARRSEAQTNFETNKSEKFSNFAKAREDKDSKAIKKPENSMLRESQNDISLKKKGASTENDIFDERIMSENPLSRSLIGIRPSLNHGELETVRRIPSDTFAACQAAFLHSAPDETENEGTVLLPLQAEASFDSGWIDSVTSILKPGATSCLLSETIEERVASASGLSTHCGSICRLLPQPQDTCEAVAAAAAAAATAAAAAVAAAAASQTIPEERRHPQRRDRSPSSSSSSSECESVGSASSRGGSRRCPLDRPPTPVSHLLSQRMMSAHSRRSVLLPGTVAESNEEM